MKKRFFVNLLAVILCAALLISCLPFAALAESADTDVQMTEGGVIAGFVPAGTDCTSSDPSIAWVDKDGNLNAMKAGTATVSDGTADYTVTVGDYEDGSPVVGNLKILARYNDSMQFYDGHVYLLFTSYQDGVEVYVDDLYGYYVLSDQYYEDIREDIANGSNHTGSDTEDYFAYTSLYEPLVLDRGDVVTIGMYRGFDLSVPQAALGSITNSTYWADIVAAGKASVIESIFRFLESGSISAEEALNRVKNALAEIGIDYTVALDGVVEGGVCFNRELYNQKLEWDQYENVTYEMDITQNQLDTLIENLSGNLNRFSILKNSCATVALRAWNAAVGTTDGEPNAYYLETSGTGIFALVDAPKTVRDSIVDRLPGYYLNNAEGVAEPDAGYQDETGWVYVSAPEKVDPPVITYHNDTFVIDEGYSTIPEIVKAIDGEGFTFGKEAPAIDVTIRGDFGKTSGTIESVDFTCNGKTVTLDGEDEPELYISFMTPYEEVAEGEYYVIVDNDGNEVGADYYDGMLSIVSDRLPITYNISTDVIPEEQPMLFTYVLGDYEADVETEFYRYTDGEKEIIDGIADVAPGEKIYIKAAVGEDEKVKSLDDITLNQASVLDSTHYDAEEGAYFIIIPEDEMQFDLTVRYGEIEIARKNSAMKQVVVGDVLQLSDFVTYTVDGMDKNPDDTMEWGVLSGDTLTADGSSLAVTGAGSAMVEARCKANTSIRILFLLISYESLDNMAAITADDEFLNTILITVVDENGEIEDVVPFSGYLIEKGSRIALQSLPSTAVLPYNVTANGTKLQAGDVYTVTGDTELKASFYEAEVKNMPKSVTLADKDDTYQLNAKVSYSGLLNQFKTVYDGSIEYVSSDPLVEVDENGLITLAGDIPEGGCLVFVTAYAGSSDRKVYATTKVVVGDYQGERIVGSLTVSARPIVKGQLISHAAITFTAYEDTDLDISYYEYYKPNEKFRALMQDYADHPENYSSDPVLYNNNELGLEDRDSYFDITTAGAFSEPQPVQISAGDSITLSNYGVESSNLNHVLKALENSSLSTVSPQTQGLVEYIRLFMDGEEYDGADAFDDMIQTLVQIYIYTRMLGFNPADGVGDGGLMINREAYNQFRRADSQTPNHYYTVDITADELAMMKAYLADPNNNYYSLMVKSCATSTVNIWNATLSDRPELQIKGNYTGLAADPMSIYYEIGLMKYKSDIDGEAGDDFYPRIVVCEKSEDTEAMYQLGDADGDGVVTILDATAIQKFLAGLIGKDEIDAAAACIADQSVNILDATRIQRFLAGMDNPYAIGKLFSRTTAA